MYFNQLKFLKLQEISSIWYQVVLQHGTWMIHWESSTTPIAGLNHPCPWEVSCTTAICIERKKQNIMAHEKQHTHEQVTEYEVGATNTTLEHKEPVQLYKLVS